MSSATSNRSSLCMEEEENCYLCGGLIMLKSTLEGQRSFAQNANRTSHLYDQGLQIATKPSARWITAQSLPYVASNGSTLERVDAGTILNILSAA